MLVPITAPAPHLEQLVVTIASRTASLVGGEYFRSVVDALAEELNFAGAYVAHRPTTQDPDIVLLASKPAALAGLRRSFELSGTLAETALTRSVAILVRRQGGDQARDDLLDALDAEDCQMVATHDAAGVPNGVVGVVNSSDPHNRLGVEAVLRLVGARIGAEVERFHAMQALRDESQLLRDFSNRAADMILRTRPGPSPVVDYVNPAFETLTGYPVEDLYRDPQLLLRIAHPEDRESFARMLLGGDDSQPTVRRWIRRDGSILWTEGRRTAVHDAAGRVTAFEIVARDITAQHVAESLASEIRQRQRLLLEALPDTVIHLDREAAVLEFVPANERDPFHAWIADGSVLWASLPEDIGQPLSRALEEAFATGSLQAHAFTIASEPHDRTFEARIVPLASTEAVMFVREVTGDIFLSAASERTRRTEELETKVERRILRANPYRLTFREYTVLELVAQGLTDKHIASQLGISLNTVGKHVSNILGKMGVSSRTEASVHAIQEGLID